MTWALWLVGGAVLFAVASVLALYSYGRFAKRARGPESRHIPPPVGASGPLDTALPAPPRPDATGLVAVFDNEEAFALRALSVRAATRSLDIMSYIWRDDLAGRLLARELLVAADRGVRVRLLLDDINAQGFDPSYLGLDGHPGIEVRLFNPIRTRRTALRRGVELMLGAVRFNRRMHGKLWLADGRLALIGGRNVGDTYFINTTERQTAPSRDTDLAVIGPLLSEMAEGFDAYWNSGHALPIAALWRDRKGDMPRYRARLDRLAAEPRARDRLARALRGRVPATSGALLAQDRVHWTGTARLIMDPPEKLLDRNRQGWILPQLLPELMATQTRLEMTTPYFVPGPAGLGYLTALAARGVEVTVLTNALEVTNQILVHGAYRRYRRPLLAAGVRLFEYAPWSVRGAPRPMLHAKGFVIDDRRAFVGSFNFDMRSVFLNTEIGLLFEAPGLVEELGAAFRADTAPTRAHALQLEGTRLVWHCRATDAAGRTERMMQEPGAGAWARGVSWIVGHLPIHRQL